KAGGAYVPIDPNYPADRISFILSDTKAQIMITDSKFHSHVRLLDDGSIENSKPNHFIMGSDSRKDINLYQNIIIIDSNEFVQVLSGSSSANLVSNIVSSNLAYVIYTSGTTGKPKGVMIEHKNLVAFILGFVQYPFGNEIPLNMLSTTNYVFDVFALEYMLPLLNGGIVDLVDLFNLSGKLNLFKYDCIQITPSKVDWFINSIDYTVGADLTHRLRLLVGGEALNQTTLYKLNSLYEKLLSEQQINCEIINVYGPTETTIWSAARILDLQHIAGNLGNIGNSLINQSVYILDNNLNLLPVGAIGEIYIGGAGLARGYLNQPDLTKEKFIVNPFRTYYTGPYNSSQRLYKTGDLARYLTDGSLEYIGRTDNQVKIRGHRIELSEIENVLNEYPDIKQSIVLIKNKHSKDEGLLIAYYVSGIKLDEDLVKAHLLNHLPYYMLPTIFIHINKVPLNASGKIDRNALPEADLIERPNSIHPRNELEKQIAGIWSEILGIPFKEIGINDNFYKLGGNSLLVIQLKNKLTDIKQFKHITVADLFKYTTIEQLIKFVMYDNASKTVKISQNKLDYEPDIAIIALSGAFSGCENIEEYWDLIRQGQEGYTRLTIDECQALDVPASIIENPNFIPVTGHIPDIDKFDAAFWDISPLEAKKLDPHIRKFLEICWFLLEDSGYINKRSDLTIGVLAGGAHNRYMRNLGNSTGSFLDIWEEANLSATSSFSTQVSYLLGLTGPSININTACSTSLVAVIEACHKLAQGNCDMAIAGAASLLMPNEVGYVYEEGMIFSKDGHCRTFDDKATGTIIGSGVGGVLLKRLSDAKRDNDQIIAVIKGYASNNDGKRKMSYTAPSNIGQTECILNAWKIAGIDSNQINYIECHGTGTSLGDPIEIKALSDAFLYYENKTHLNHSCFIGSVKANIGHADTASGIAGLIKVCKMLGHNIIPGQINYDSPNKEIDFDQSNFKIITTENPWERVDGLPKIAGISSFGIGGTNTHLIVSEYISLSGNLPVTSKKTGRYILPISAKSSVSLEMYKEKFIKYLQSALDNIEDIAYTLQQRREYFDYKISIVCTSKQEAINKLVTIRPVKTRALAVPADIIFMFPGQGSQYINMSLPLYKNNSEYKSLVDKCINIVNKHIDVPFETILFPELNPNKINHDINQTKWAQIALFIVNYSLAKFLEDSLQLKPGVYIGHSIGEFVAATMSGVFSLEDAIFLVISRAKLMQLMEEGSMLAISADIDTIKDFINQSGCEISVINSPKDYIASGTKSQITSLKNILDKKHINSVVLKVSHAYHSRAMETAAMKFADKFAGIRLNIPVHKFISNITGDFITDKDAISPEYWGSQIRKQVLFGKGIETIFTDCVNPFFIEVGPGRSLSSAVKANSFDTFANTVQLLNSQKENTQYLDISSKEDLISKLWIYGYTDIFNKCISSYNNEYKVVRLPNYCFEKNVYWTAKQIPSINQNVLQVLPKAQWLNIPVWKKIGRLSTKKIRKISSELFLIFIDKVYKEYDNLVISGRPIIFVLADITAADFKVIDQSNFIINPTVEVAYQMLVEYLKKNNIKPTAIIHANTLSKNSFRHKTLNVDQYLGMGFYSLFLIQKYILSKLSEAKFIVLTQNIAKISDQDNINPYNGALVGAIRAIKHELINIKTCILDIGEYNMYTSVHIMEFIENENNFIQDNLYALRFNSLWIESFERLTYSQPELIITNEDVILITGGLGGIGLSVAWAIAQKNKVTFILVSRNNILDIKEPNQYILNQLDILKEIKSYGSKVDIQCLDMSDLSSVKKLVKYIINQYNKLSGIIHTAGSAPLFPSDRSLPNIKTAIRAKIHGVANLALATNKLDIKYFFMTSSLASILGDVNRIEYCAANSYLDYVPISQLFSPNCHTLTINWPGWLDVGMVVKHAVEFENQEVDKIIMLNTVNKKEGAQLFYDLIQFGGQHQIIISKLDLNLITKNFFKEHTTKSLTIDKVITTVVEKNLPAGYYDIATVFLELLDIDQISIYDNFFDLGGTSLSAMKLVAGLKKIDINLNLTDIISINSIDLIYKMNENAKVKIAADKILVP
ncbi:MAG: hypothetical protein K0R49_910, partial [Burkholderiales bacterium]|nr:hypothetical protein [Burkholderiales bacterium]